MNWIFEKKFLFLMLISIAFRRSIGYPFWPSRSPPFHTNEDLGSRWRPFGRPQISPPHEFRPFLPRFGSPPGSNPYIPRHDASPGSWGAGFSNKISFDKPFSSAGNFASLFKDAISSGPFSNWPKVTFDLKDSETTRKPHPPISFSDIWSSKINKSSDAEKPNWFRRPPFFLNSNKEQPSPQTDSKVGSGQEQNTDTEDETKKDESETEISKSDTETTSNEEPETNDESGEQETSSKKENEKAKDTSSETEDKETETNTTTKPKEETNSESNEKSSSEKDNKETASETDKKETASE